MTRRPHLVVVAHAVHEHGGMERATAQLVRRARVDFDVTVISNELEAEPGPDLAWERVRVPAAPFPAKFAAFWNSAGRRVRRARPGAVLTVGAIVPTPVDVAAVHFCHAGFQGALAGVPKPPQSLLRAANNAATARLSLLAERWCYRPGRVGALTAVSAGLAEELRAAYPGVPVHVVPNGVDSAHYSPDPGIRSQVRAELGVSEDDVVCLFVGGDWSRKGLGVAVEALALVREPARDRVRLWVVGSGDEAACRAHAERLGVGQQVRFFGQQPDVRRFLRGADVFVLPSLYEAFNLSAMEAAAVGLPVLTTPINGMGELTAGGGGVLLERTPEAFAAAVGDLVGDAERRDRMSRSARHHMALYTWEETARRTLALCREAAGKRASRR